MTSSKLGRMTELHSDQVTVYQDGATAEDLHRRSPMWGLWNGGGLQLYLTVLGAEARAQRTRTTVTGECTYLYLQKNEAPAQDSQQEITC